MDEPGRRERLTADLLLGDRGRLEGRGDHHQPALRLEHAQGRPTRSSFRRRRHPPPPATGRPGQHGHGHLLGGVELVRATWPLRRIADRCSARAASRWTSSASTASTGWEVRCGRARARRRVRSSGRTARRRGWSGPRPARGGRAGGDDLDRGDDPFDLAADVGEVPGRPALGRDASGPGRPRPGGSGRSASLRTAGSVGGAKPSSTSSATQRVAGPSPRWARPCRVAPPPTPAGPMLGAAGPGSSPGCSSRHSASYRSMFRAICAARALNAPAYGASCGSLRCRVEDVAVGGEAAGTAGRSIRGVADAVDGPDGVDHADRVQSPPPSGGEHPGIDLQVQVTVRVAGPRGVVPHHRGLQLLHRYLYLSAAGTHPGGRVLGQPPDDLDRGPLLGGVEGVRDLRVQGRGQGPGLRAVDDDLDEPQRRSSVRSRPFGLPVSTSSRRPTARRSGRRVGRANAQPRRPPFGEVATYRAASPVPSAR